MQLARWTKQLILVTVAVCLLAACTSAPSKYDEIQSETTGSQAPAAVAQEAEQGSTFNQFFPSSEGDYEVVPAQEKKGFAEYKLNQNGTTLAMLTINDTASVPTAAAKYEGVTETVGGYPAVQQGKNITGILVNGRYQVKVLSRDESFTPEQRAEWIQKFDLDGLSQLEAGAALNVPAKVTAAPALSDTVSTPVPKTSVPEEAPTLIPVPAT
ncbi:MAG: hypothetical protein AAGH78_03430 [Cyanobacteria bacterium P01_H01_bin.58]